MVSFSYYADDSAGAVQNRGQKRDSGRITDLWEDGDGVSPSKRLRAADESDDWGEDDGGMLKISAQC